jgi:hypothetical protein
MKDHRGVERGENPGQPGVIAPRLLLQALGRACRTLEVEAGGFSRP